ncbi:MAG: choice-of-anchor D domain-containing protein, partial [Deltaproteobacteria bacterium]|nr:choice-of-anchor D domain-containing protein [Deltaproteobacteria bacterium]
ASTGGTQSASVTASVVSLGALRLTPGSQQFGDIVLGQDSAVQIFTLSNIGGSATTVPSAGLTGAAATDFRISDNTCSAALPAATSCSISVVMRPSVAGARAAQLGVSASTGGTVSATLAGNGLDPARLTVSPNAHDFGSIVIGASSAARSFTISNSGDVPSTVPTLTMAGTVPADFRISANTCTTPVAAGGSCSLAITMVPAAAGTRLARLDVSASTGGSTSAALSGTGLTPARLTIAPGARDFGSIVTGQTSAAQPFTVTNSGGAPSTIPSAALSGSNAGDFTISASTCTAVLPAGGTCSISVTMTPTVAAARAASLGVSAATGGSASATLTGTGLAPARLTIAPASRDFGAIVTGQTSAAQGFTITNAGGAPSSVPTASLGGGSPGDFAIASNTCTAVLPASGTCSVGVTMTPSATGARAASLVVSAATGGSVTGTLTGTGLAPARLIADATLNDFGTIDVGQQSSAFTWTISNVGAVAATGLTLSPTGDASQFSAVNSCTATLASGTSCVVTVRFVPTGAGAFNAKLTMSASVGGSVTLNVLGTGRGNQLLTVATAGTGSGGVNAVMPAGGIACPTDCTEGYPFNTSVTLVATPVPGSAFTGWSDLNCRGTGSCVVVMNGPQTITANFTLLPRFRLTVDRTLGSASGTVVSTSDTPVGINCGADCFEDYISGTSVTLRATPAASPANVIFTGWSGACLSAGTSPTCTVTMSAIRNVGASFAVRQFTLAISNSNSGTLAGSVQYGGYTCSAGSQCAASFDQNSTVTIQPVPRTGPGAGPDYWWADPTVSPNDPCRNTLHNRPCTVTMSQARSVSVFFGFVVN